VALDGGDPIGGLIVLGELALAGQLGVGKGDRLAIGVEVLERLGGGQDARPVEDDEDGLLGVEHRVLERALDLEGETGLGAGDDPGVHRGAPGVG
jgi:hypothetical protein